MNPELLEKSCGSRVSVNLEGKDTDTVGWRSEPYGTRSPKICILDTLPEGFCSMPGFGPEPERGWDLPEALQ